MVGLDTARDMSLVDQVLAVEHERVGRAWDVLVPRLVAPAYVEVERKALDRLEFEFMDDEEESRKEEMSVSAESESACSPAKDEAVVSPFSPSVLSAG